MELSLMEVRLPRLPNDFVFGGGDGYDFSGATNVSMTIPIRDVLVSAIEKAKTITPKKVDYIKDISK